MIQRCTNHLSHFELFNVVQIIQRNTNHSTQYKSLNVVQIIKRSANLSTLCKSLLNAVQIFQIVILISLLSLILSYSNLEEV